MRKTIVRKKYRKRYIIYGGAVILVLAILLSGITFSGAANDPPAELTEPVTTPSPTFAPTPEPTPVILTLNLRSGHPALMSLEEDGLFHPENTVTRREIFLTLAGMLSGLAEREGGRWSDFDAGDQDYWTIASLYAAGLLPDTDTFRPEEPVTRGELAGFFGRLSARMTGEASDMLHDLSLAVSLGTLTEAGTADSGNQALTRGEIALILETLAGREPEGEALFFSGLVPEDLRSEPFNWAYMADAVMAEAAALPEPGLYRLYGWLYALGEDGQRLRDESYELWRFDSQGRYTTGDEELDGYLAQALADSGADALAGREALEAVYLYIKENFDYVVTPADMTVEEVGATGWEYARALRFFQNGGGTCYGYAATFGLLARLLGEEAHIVSAQINEYYGPHSFVVIPEDGTDWIYDVELEDARPYRFDDLGLFRVRNFAIYNYWYTPDW